MPKDKKTSAPTYNKKTGTHSNFKTNGFWADLKFEAAKVTGQATKDTQCVRGKKGKRMTIA